MARPKKKPEYDSDQMAQQLMEAVTDAYLNPPQGTEDDTGHMQLKQLAEEFSMTPLKVRKLLITTGAYQTAISKFVNTLFREGKSVAEIQELTNLSRALNILVWEYRCSGGTDTANPAAGNRCSGTGIPHLLNCLLPASLLA